MTAQDQERHFALLRATHPEWSTAFCSGYVHGAEDESVRKNPPGHYVRGTTDYSLGYLTGFAVHRGPDAESEKWFRFVGRLVKRGTSNG